MGAKDHQNHGRDHRRKGADPTGDGIFYAVKLSPDDEILEEALAPSFWVLITTDMDGSHLRSAVGFINTASSSGTVEVGARWYDKSDSYNDHNMFDSRIVIDEGDLDSYDSGTPAVPQTPIQVMNTGDLVEIRPSEFGADAMGLGVVLEFGD